MTAPTANLIEIFSAIQGEGLNVGTRQIFVRFGACDLRCTYCDSAHTWQKQATCLVETTPGQRDFREFANPVAATQILDWLAHQHLPHLHDSISLTGGEPLLHSSFLAYLLPQLRSRIDLPIYLETAGHRPAQLANIIDYLDLVGMDIKLPSVSGENHWAAHSEFLTRCHQHPRAIFVKAIVDRHTTPADLEQLAQLVARVDRQIPLFLQPVTPLGATLTPQPPSPEQVLAWQALLKQSLADVRVVPQTHKMLHQR